MIPTGRHRVVQVHPSLRCNLECLHCYSESGPRVSTSLPVEVACAVATDAASEGYAMLAVSGGEPLLYDGLHDLLDAARDAGMATALTTNGTLSTPARLDGLRDRLDLMTVSVDGTEASHDRIRNRDGAFRRLEANLANVRAAGIPFGVIFTLTQLNLGELDRVAAFAAEQGAALLQVHPLEMAGRARSDMVDEQPDNLELGFGFAEALRVREQYEGRMHVHLDVATRAGLAELRRREADASPPTCLADVVSPLVVEADGSVVPLTYGFPKAFGLGSLHDAPLRDLAAAWLVGAAAPYQALLSTLHDDAAWTGRLPVMNLYETASSLAAAAPA